jgi:nucleotide-binding universal stress UspA family protein
VINIRNILYATDFSSHSNQAYFHAVELAQGYGASLTILHVCNSATALALSADGGAFPPALDNVIEDQGYWREQLEQIRPVNSSLKVSHVLLEGDPAEEIIRFAAEAHMDLIVIGTHGRTGLERLLMGSVAERILRGAPCSVLIAKIPKALVVDEKPAAEPVLNEA